MKRSEREFNAKYNEFIEDQANFPQNILEKRHKELQELMENSMAFKKEITEAMRQARKEMMDPLRAKLDDAIQAVCTEEAFDYIIDTHQHTYLFVNPERGVDILPAVKAKLGIE